MFSPHQIVKHQQDHVHLDLRYDYMQGRVLWLPLSYSNMLKNNMTRERVLPHPSYSLKHKPKSVLLDHEFCWIEVWLCLVSICKCNELYKIEEVEEVTELDSKDSTRLSIPVSPIWLFERSSTISVWAKNGRSILEKYQDNKVYFVSF
jgi:hypothetical protein